MGGGASTIKDEGKRKEFMEKAEKAISSGRVLNEEMVFLSSKDPDDWAGILFKILVEEPEGVLQSKVARAWIEEANNETFDDTTWAELSHNLEEMHLAQFCSIASHIPESEEPKHKGMRKRISCLLIDKPGLSIEELLEEENKAAEEDGSAKVTEEDVKEALRVVKGKTMLRGSFLGRPMDKETIVKVHYELSHTKDIHAVFNMYDADGDGRVTKEDVYRVITQEGNDIDMDQAFLLCNEIAKPGETTFGFDEFAVWMRSDDEVAASPAPAEGAIVDNIPSA